MSAPAPKSLSPAALASISPLAPLAVAKWQELRPVLSAKFSAFNDWCAEVQATPLGKFIIVLLCLVEITLVTLVIWRVRYLQRRSQARSSLSSREKPALA